MSETKDSIIIKGRTVYPGKVEGEALVSKMPLMGWGNVNVKQGFTVERDHPLYEVPLKDKILVFPYVRGSGGFVMYGHTKRYGVNPLAMLCTEPISYGIFAAMTMKQPMMTDFDIDPVKIIETGDYIIVNADEGFIEIVKNV
ncbi:aconitase X swivel domain-containing protein [Alkalibaculum sporogenes]|nr:DUF126 domain-containing protein [Alkalibaculum sporogenes]